MNGFFKDMNKDVTISNALWLAYKYGQIDGGHHKAWVIDQMVRQLTGDNYESWVAEYEDGGEYEWDEGVTP